MSYYVAPEPCSSVVLGLAYGRPEAADVVIAVVGTELGHTPRHDNSKLPFYLFVRLQRTTTNLSPIVFRFFIVQTNHNTKANHLIDPVVKCTEAVTCHRRVKFTQVAWSAVRDFGLAPDLFNIFLVFTRQLFPFCWT